MENNLSELLLATLKVQRGTIISVNALGEILVSTGVDKIVYTCEFLQTNNDTLPVFNVGDSVLFGDDQESKGSGYIIGILHRCPDNAVKEKQKSIVVTIDEHKEIKLNAENKIEIRCGKSSMTMKKDGRIIIKGTNIISRASGANKVKGAAVSIN